MSTVTPIDQLRYGLPQAGRIRTGEQYKTRSGKMAPRTLDHFRFTTSNRELIDWCAEQYGGIVKPFDSQGSDDRWMLDSDRTELDVIVAVPGSYSLSYEKRGDNGALERICDGRTCDVMTFTPDDAGWRSVECICREKGLDDWTKECTKQLRLPVKLPDCPTGGVWRWDSSSENSIREIRGTIEELAMLAGRGRHACKMRLEARRSKGFDKQGKPVTKHFTVVVLDPGVSVESLVAGDSRLAQLPAPPVLPTAAELEAGLPTVTPSQAGEPAGNDGVGEGQHPPVGASPTLSTVDDEPIEWISTPHVATCPFSHDTCEDTTCTCDCHIVDAELVDDDWTTEDEAKAQAVGIAVGHIAHEFFDAAKWRAGLSGREKSALLRRAREIQDPVPASFDAITDDVLAELRAGAS